MRRWNWVGIGVVVLIGIGVVVWLLRNPDQGGPIPEEAPEAHPVERLVAPPTPLPTATPDIATTTSPLDVAEDSFPTSEVSSSLPLKGASVMIQGRITYPDGAPAPDVSIEVQQITYSLPKTIASTVSGSDGRYRVNCEERAALQIVVTTPGYIRIQETLLLSPSIPGASGRQVMRRDFVLSPGAILAGRVVDGKGAAIPGAIVSAVFKTVSSYARNLPITTEVSCDDTGTFRIETAPPGEVHLVAMADGFSPETKVANAPESHITIVLSPGSAGGIVEGIVFNKTTGKGVGDARVTLTPDTQWLNRQGIWGKVQTSQGTLILSASGELLSQSYEVTSDASGMFEFTQMNPGTYLARPEKEGLFPLNTKSDPGLIVPLKESEVKTGVELFLYEGHRIFGRVVNKETAEPLEEATAFARDIQGRILESITESDGRYEFRVSGSFVLLSGKKKGYQLSQSFSPQGPLFKRLTPEVLEIIQDIEMVPAVTVSGRVVQPDGSAAGNAEVSAGIAGQMQSHRAFVPVKDDGSFTLEVPPYSSFSVVARAPGFPQSTTDPIEIHDTPLADIEVHLVPGCTVSGIVVDDDDHGVPNSIVTCWFWFDTGISAKELDVVNGVQTEQEGRFLLSNIPSGEIQLFAENAGYSKSEILRLDLSPGEVREDIRLVLAASSFLGGRITNPEGEAIEGAKVNVSGSNSYGSSSTDASGEYYIEQIRNTPHGVTISHPDHESLREKNVEVNRNDADFVLGYSTGVELVGTVLDAETKKAVESFDVFLDHVPLNVGAQTIRDSKIPGRFVVTGLIPESMIRVRIHASDYPAIETEWIRIEKSQQRIERTFELGTQSTIRGRVVKKNTGDPLPSIEVALKSSPSPYNWDNVVPHISVLTDDEGRFQFDKAMAGHHVVIVTPPSPFPQVSRQIETSHGDTRDLGDLEIASSGAIVNGRLIRNPGEETIPNQVIELNQQGSGFKVSTTTNEQGEYRFEGVPDGRLFLKCESRSVFRFFSLEPGETKTVDLILGGGTVKGQVLRGKTPIAASLSAHNPATDYQRSGRTDGEGRFVLEDLTPGRWSISAHDQLEFVFKIVDVEEGKTVELTLLFPTGTITGRVLDSTEAPVETAEVILQRVRTDPNDPEFLPKSETRTTQSNGAFRFEKLPRGVYRVMAKKDGLGVTEVDDLGVEDTPITVDLHLGETQGGTLLSSVYDIDTGNPVQEVEFILSNESGPVPFSAIRNDQGILEITDLPPGEYRVHLGGKRYSIAQHDVRIVSGEIASIEDGLCRAGNLAWRIVTGEGVPVEAKCRVEPTDPSNPESPREGVTESIDGRLWMLGLRPGSYRGTATLPDGRTVQETFSIVSGEDSAVLTTIK